MPIMPGSHSSHMSAVRLRVPIVRGAETEASSLV